MLQFLRGRVRRINGVVVYTLLYHYHIHFPEHMLEVTLWRNVLVGRAASVCSLPRVVVPAASSRQWISSTPVLSTSKPRLQRFPIPCVENALSEI